jgi:hypothetical protein
VLTTGNDGWQETQVVGIVADVREHSVEGTFETAPTDPATFAANAAACRRQPRDGRVPAGAPRLAIEPMTALCRP